MTIIDSILRKRAAERAAEDTAAPVDQADQWKHFTAPELLVAKVCEAYALLASIVSHESVALARGRTTLKEQSIPSQMVASARKNGRVLHKMAVSDDSVTMAIELPTLKCFAAGMPTRPTGTQAAAWETGRKILKVLFPKLKLEGMPLSDGYATTPVAPARLQIEQLGSVKIPGLAALDFNSWPKELRGSATLVMQVFEIESLGSSSLTQLSENDDVAFKVGVIIRIKLPMAYCLWSTDSSPENFSAITLWLQFAKRWSWYNTDKPSGKPPNPIASNPARAQQITAFVEKKYGFKPKVQCNAEGICSLPDGRIMWVPEANEVNIAGALNECLRPAKPSDEPDALREIDMNPIRNRHVGTSWLTNKTVITDENGEFHVIDLNGARPPSPAALAHFMTSPIGDMFHTLVTEASHLGVQIDLTAVRSYGVEFETVTWENLMDVPYSLGEDAEGDTQLSKELFKIGQQLATAYQLMTTSNLPVLEQMETRGYLALFGVYAKDRMKYAAALAEQTALNRAHVDSSKPPLLHDMGGVRGLMPHQVRVLSELDTNPTGALIDVRAGGGKTLAIIGDIASLLAVGKIKRPAVMMPRNLLGQFANEIVKFTNGHLRPYVIDNYSWAKLTYDKPFGSFAKLTYDKGLGADVKSVINMLKSQPVNTVFLIDYNWLSLDAEPISAGEESAPFYPRATILDRIGVDYLTSDESQRIKNLDANRSGAAQVAFANAKYRRISSGTILHNTPKDLVGQMAVIEPLALGQVGEFLKAGGSLKSTQMRKMQANAVSSFARKIQVPRREWAHLLPTIRENVHLVSMTRKQQDFNNKVMEKTLAQLADDPALKRLQKMDPTKAEDKIAALFKRHFATLEIWINAPDSQAENSYGKAFSELSGITDADLKSPKIDKIDEIIDMHFNGGVFDSTEGSETLEPDRNKIIVVGYNKEVSLHIFRHSKWAHEGIHYGAGDDQALAKFESNKPDSPRILYADLGSITEGKNLQIASRLIVTQIVWTPGMQEQLTARIWRPFGGKDHEGNPIPRPFAWVDFVVCAPSIEVPKQARLIAKQVTNLLAEEEDSSPTLRALVTSHEVDFAKVQSIKMSLDLIRDESMESRKGEGVPDILNDQFTAYALVKGWEKKEFKAARQRLRDDIEERTGKRLSKTADIGALSMVAVESKPTPAFVPGKALQAQGYVTWTQGFTGFNPTSLNLKPLSIALDDEEDGDEAVKEDIITVVPGDPVLTQFGPGTVVGARKGAADVDVFVPGFKNESFKVRRYLVLAAPDMADKAALATLVRNAGKAGAPLLRMDGKTKGVQAVPGKITEQTIVDAKRESKGKMPKLDKSVSPRAPTRVLPPEETPRRPRAEMEDKVPSRAPTRTPGVRPTDPYISDKKSKTPIAEEPRLRGKQPAEEPRLRGRQPVEEPRLRGRQPVEEPPKRRMSVIDIREKKPEELWTELTADVILFNGVVCLRAMDTDETVDTVLGRNGFDRIGRAATIPIKSPKGFRAVLALLSDRFDIPRANQKVLDTFADIYDERRQQVEFMKAKELPFHQLWLKDQRIKAKSPNEIRPWPVVKDGRPVIYINRETCPAANKLQKLTMPMGAYPLKPVKSSMIAMVRSTRDARTLIAELKAKHIRILDEKQVLAELNNIKG